MTAYDPKRTLSDTPRFGQHEIGGSSIYLAVLRSSLQHRGYLPLAAVPFACHRHEFELSGKSRFIIGRLKI